MSIIIPSDWRQRVALLRIQAEDLGGMASALAEQGNYRSEDPIFKVSVILRQLCERRQAAADELTALGEATDREERARTDAQEERRRRDSERMLRKLFFGALFLIGCMFVLGQIARAWDDRRESLSRADYIPQREWMAASGKTGGLSSAAPTGSREP